MKFFSNYYTQISYNNLAVQQRLVLDAIINHGPIRRDKLEDTTGRPMALTRVIHNLRRAGWNIQTDRLKDQIVAGIERRTMGAYFMGAPIWEPPQPQKRLCLLGAAMRVALPYLSWDSPTGDLATPILPQNPE